MKQFSFDIKYDGKFSYSMGYSLYSAFLENLGDSTSEKTHNSTDFSQFLTPFKWAVSSNDDLEFKNEYFLSKYNTSINLFNMSVKNIDEQEIADKFLINETPKRIIRIKILSPTTFKQDGNYVLFPTAGLIMQSLTNKWNNWAEKFILEDMEWNQVRISKYNLRSYVYQLKGAKIQAFMGEVELSFWGSESINRLGNLVCNFGNYSGMGIKTSLGMGGIFVE